MLSGDNSLSVMLGHTHTAKTVTQAQFNEQVSSLPHNHE
jgi:hypothetical protein